MLPSSSNQMTAVGRILGELLERALGLFGGDFHAAQLQPVGRHARQLSQTSTVLDRKVVVRSVVNDAQRAQRKPFGRQQGHPGVEAQLGFAGDEGVVVETFVVHGIGHHHHAVLRDGVRAERGIAAHVDIRTLQAGAGREEDVVVADHVDHRNGHAEHPQRDLHHRVQAGQGAIAAQPVFRQGLKPFLFRFKDGGTLHRK